MIKKLFKDISCLIDFLQKKEEISLQNFSEDNLKKVLLLASASYFETQIQQIVEEFANKSSNNNDALVNFLKNKAINRQYHTYFSWDANNANTFLRLFGESFKENFNSNKDSKLENSIKAFLEIGRERNRLVHQNFANYTIEKTSKEIFDLHNSAIFFVEEFKNQIMEK